MPRPATRFAVAPYDFAAAMRLVAELAVPDALAQVLVRRGLADPVAARRFLAADVSHPLAAFGGLDQAAEQILGHVAAGTLITVHGDYDADGVCSTAILVRVLRSLGADVDWFLPSRSEDGYGLQAATVSKLAARGTRLLLTADCAITAVAEVAAAKAAGMDVIVTDHHSPRADGALPDASIVHPRLGGHPCPDLCAAGVAYKVAAALLSAAGHDPALADEDLDLVALATVADVVPLTDENRRLVRVGLRALSRTRKPGLQALMDVARVDPSGVDAGAVGFRLAPRINAAGRLRRADAALELLLTPDAARAREIAAALDACNTERREVETRIRFEAERQVAEHPGPPPAYVLAAENWHPGVVGIVAARIAERHRRPAVLIALDGETGTGSGRSIPAFDLLAGLEAGGDELLRFGGHRAAAGLTIEASRIDAFRAAFVEHAAGVLRPEDLVREERVDAVVGGDALHLGLAEELARLGPFGAQNPEPTLLVAAATLDEPRALGEGRHVAFRLTSGGARSRAVCFGAGSSLPAPAGVPVDVAVRLEIDRWGGGEEPRLRVRAVRPPAGGAIDVLGEPATFCAGIAAELDRALEPATAALRPIRSLDDVTAAQRPAGRAVLDRRGAGIAGVLADLVAAGEPVLALCAHAGHRAAALAGRTGGFALASWHAVEAEPALAAPFAHVVLLDPPAHPSAGALATRLPGEGWTHLAWGEPELRFSLRVLEWDFDLRAPLADLYRSLRAAGHDRRSGAACETLLRGTAAQPCTPALAGRFLRVLSDLSLADVATEPVLSIALPDTPPRTALERSPAFCTYTTRLEDGRRFLTTSSRPAMAAA